LSETKYKIVTCRHNVDNISNLKFVSKEIEIPYCNIKYSDNIDCVVVDVSAERLDIEPLTMFLTVDVLSEIVTMGYSVIPRSDGAYLMVHKGEVNGIIKDYYENNEFIIFSAKTSSGNSGSPLINKDGAVVGMVANELFDKTAYQNQGKPPYFAAIPSEVIMSIFGLNTIENIFDNNLLFQLLANKTKNQSDS